MSNAAVVFTILADVVLSVTLEQEFFKAKDRLMVLKKRLHGGWLDFGIYDTIRDVDEDLQKGTLSALRH